MQYARASASDYDDWKIIHENPGWGSDELVPLLRKVSWVRPAVYWGTISIFFCFWLCN